MFKQFVNIPPLPVQKDHNGNVVKLPVDQFYSQDFCQNAAGWIASDVSLLMRAATQQEYDMIASRLNEIKKSQPDTSKMSDQDIIKTIWHRGAQTPSEIESFMDYYNKVNPVDVNNVDPNVKQNTIDFSENAKTETSEG